MRAEAARLREQLDRPQPVLGNAFLDLARLLVGVHVQRQRLAGGVGAQLLEPLPRAGADGVGREPDSHSRRTHRLELLQVLGRRVLAEALQPAAPVGREQEDDLDPGLRRRLDRRVSLRQPQVVELPDNCVARGQHLAVHRDVA